MTMSVRKRPHMRAAQHLARGVNGEPEPAWDVAYLFPVQGDWTEGDYLALDTNRLVELSNGVLEVLPMPTTAHHMVVAYLYGLLLGFSSASDLGTVLFAGVRVRLWSKKFREPDVVFMRREHEHRIGHEYWDRADLVMEVVSGSDEDRRRDLRDKRRDYARAGIPEYWIVDPAEGCITVLRLAGKRYVVHGRFEKESTATSHLLPGFSVDVSAVLAQGERKRASDKSAHGSKRPRR